MPRAESCQKRLARKWRVFVLTQKAAYNLKYTPDLAVLLEKKKKSGSWMCTMLSILVQNWRQSMQGRR